MGASDFEEGEYSAPKNYVGIALFGVSLVNVYLLGFGTVNLLTFFLFGLLLLLVLYANNRYKRRSINVESMAIFSIEAEPTVSWQVLDIHQEVFKEGNGQAQFSVPVSLFYLECSPMFHTLPKKWWPKLEQSRFCKYKPRMMYNYIVETRNKSDVLVCQLQLAQYCMREESVDGEVYPCLFIMDPVQLSRHWIWPDWFEMFTHQDGES